MDQNEELRRDVATANRILERVGLSSAFGHASARLPGTNTFLIPTRRSPGLAEASTLTQIGQPHRVVHNQGGIFAEGVPEYGTIGLVRSAELGNLLAQVLGAGNAVMMRGHGITTAFGDVRSATVAACYLEESAALQLRMLAAAGGDPGRIRAFTRDEALPLRDQIGPSVARRAWEYFAAVAEAAPLGSALR